MVDRAAVCPGDDNIFFLSGPAGLVRDLADRSDGIPGPVPGYAVCKGGFPGIRRAVNADTGPFLLKKAGEETGEFLFYSAHGLIKNLQTPPHWLRKCKRYWQSF